MNPENHPALWRVMRSGFYAEGLKTEKGVPYKTPRTITCGVPVFMLSGARFVTGQEQRRFPFVTPVIAQRSGW